MTDEAVSHLRESAVLKYEGTPLFRPRPDPKADITQVKPFGTDEPDGIPPMPHFGEGANLLVTGSTHEERGYRRVDHPDVEEKLVNRLTDKVVSRRDEIVEVEEYELDDAEIALVGYGFTARSCLAAVRTLRCEGTKVGLLRLKTLWPFPDREIRELSEKVRRIVFPEMNLGQLAGVARQHATCDVISLQQVNGKVIVPEPIIARIKEVA